MAASDDTVNAKKMLISRASRYSGLLDVLTFAEGATAFTGAESWLAIAPDEATLGAQIDAAKAAGVSRAFLLVSEALAAPDAVASQLKEAGIDYTLMRTGPLVDAPEGGGLKLDDFDMAVCEEVPMADVFRFVTEALTLPEANGRSFSLCPSLGVSSSLKEMRLCGYERRDEVQLLLQGVIKEQDAPVELSPEEAAEKEELVLRSEAEVAAEREEELKALLARARARGEETQKKLAFEEAERMAYRKEQERYYKNAPDNLNSPADFKPDDADDKPDDDKAA